MTHGGAFVLTMPVSRCTSLILSCKLQGVIIFFSSRVSTLFPQIITFSHVSIKNYLLYLLWDIPHQESGRVHKNDRFQDFKHQANATSLAKRKGLYFLSINYKPGVRRVVDTIGRKHRKLVHDARTRCNFEPLNEIVGVFSGMNQ